MKQIMEIKATMLFDLGSASEVIDRDKSSSV